MAKEKTENGKQKVEIQQEMPSTPPAGSSPQEAPESKPGAISKPIVHVDGTNHIVAACPFCGITSTKFVEQLTATDQKRRCLECQRNFHLHVPNQTA